MTDRDWADGEPWESSSYTEKCEKCGTTNKITTADGPPSGHESYEVECAECGENLPSVKAFGPPMVTKV